jgi:hypothetical protein
MMFRTSHGDFRVSHDMHAHYAFKMLEVFAVGDSRAREVVFNSVMQPWGGHWSLGHAHPTSR